KWGLLYGVLLCGARAMGEFGAVSVVSGHIRGLTNTLPLHIEILYNEFDSTGAFAVSSLLAGLALVTLVMKFWLEARHGDALAKPPRRHGCSPHSSSTPRASWRVSARSIDTMNALLNRDDRLHPVHRDAPLAPVDAPSPGIGDD